LQKTKIFSFSSLFEEKKLVVSWRIESKSASTASSKTIGWTVTFDFNINVRKRERDGGVSTKCDDERQ
jgi:hypothetical protein